MNTGEHELYELLGELHDPRLGHDFSHSIFDFLHLFPDSFYRNLQKIVKQYSRDPIQVSYLQFVNLVDEYIINNLNSIVYDIKSIKSDIGYYDLFTLFEYDDGMAKIVIDIANFLLPEDRKIEDNIFWKDKMRIYQLIEGQLPIIEKFSEGDQMLGYDYE